MDQRTVKPKPKRERKKSSEARASQILDHVIKNKNAYGNLFDGLFWLASKVRGKHWELDDDESAELAGKVATAVGENLSEEWLRKVNEKIGQVGSVVSAVAVAGGIVYERIEEDRVIAAKRKTARRSGSVGDRPTDYPSRPDPEVSDQETYEEADT